MAPPTESEAAGAAIRRKPWYIRVFFGRDAELEPDALRVLVLVSLGMFFENYDVGLVNAALAQIALSLDMSTSETGLYMAAIRFGGVGTVVLVPLADWAGRRRIFLVALVGMSLGTLATAFSQTPLQFALVQMLTRAFLLTAAVIAVVILVEEFPAEHRGAGIGLFSLLGGVGYGLAAGLYAAIEHLPFGWRSLYAVGVLPVLLLPFFRRSLRETRRFEAHRAARVRIGGALGETLRPIALLLRTHPRRVLAIGFAGFFAALGGIVVFQYASYYLQNNLGLPPYSYSLLVVGPGMLGVLGNLIGGRGSDRFGRRRVGIACLALAPAAANVFYQGPASLPILFLAFGFYLMFMSAGDIVIRGLAAEAFPTSHRATSSGYLMLVETLGFSGGLLLVGLGADSLAALPRVVGAVACALALSAACLVFLPETRGRELETLSDEHG
jgi:putative MFS transporter